MMPAKDTRKKKLLLVGPYPPPYGGIASHLYDIMPRLVQEGYEVVSMTASDRDERRSLAGMTHLYVNKRRHFVRNMAAVLWNGARALGQRKDLGVGAFLKEVNHAHLVRTVLDAEAADAVIVYDNGTGMFLPILKDRFKRTPPVAFMIFGDFYLLPERYRAIAGYMKSVFDSTDLILSSSNYCATSISRVLGYDYPVRVIYVGVDHRASVSPENREGVRREHGIPADAKVLLFIGRMDKSMGVDFLLRQAEELLAARKDAYLLLAGAKGSLAPDVEQFAREHPRVKCCFNIPFEKKPAYYAACDVFLAPTMEKHACMGVSIKEAMAAGKPIVASSSGGIPEAVEDGVNGYLVPFVSGKMDGALFVQRCLELLSDDVLRRRMGAEGMARAQAMFTNDETVRRYREVIDVLLQSSRKREA